MRHIVEIAELKVVRSPDIIVCVGLGSCIAVALYDNRLRIGGLTHALLPSSNGSSPEPEKFVFQATTELFIRMKRAGCRESDMVSKLIGGATIFHQNSSLPSIGERNIEAGRDALRKLGLTLVAEDVGGNCGRSLEFYTLTGEIFVRSARRGIRIL